MIYAIAAMILALPQSSFCLPQSTFDCLEVQVDPFSQKNSLVATVKESFTVQTVSEGGQSLPTLFEKVCDGNGCRLVPKNINNPNVSPKGHNVLSGESGRPTQNVVTYSQTTSRVVSRTPARRCRRR